MPSPIAFCSSCGAIFKARLIGIGSGSKNISFHNVGHSCPNCGANARIADGVFDVTAEAVTIVKAPPLTRAIYESFARLIEEARYKEMEPDDFAKRAGAIHPEFGKAAKVLSGSKTPWIVALTILLMVIKSCNFNLNVNLDANQLIEQVLEHYSNRLKK